MKEALEDGGYRVEVAADGMQAFERLKAPPMPDLLLLDVRMPLKDGVTLVHAPEAATVPRSTSCS